MPPVAPLPMPVVLPGVVAPGVIRFGENVRREDGPPRAVPFATAPCAIAKPPESANTIASVIVIDEPGSRPAVEVFSAIF
jgi:hypothetical protein